MPPAYTQNRDFRAFPARRGRVNLPPENGIRAMTASMRFARIHPILLRSHHRRYLKIDQVRPATGPFHQSMNIRCFHDLEAPDFGWVQPTCAVDYALRHHPTMADKSRPDRLRIPVLELFDDHEKHGRDYSRTSFLTQAGSPAAPSPSVRLGRCQRIGQPDCLFAMDKTPPDGMAWEAVPSGVSYGGVASSRAIVPCR